MHLGWDNRHRLLNGIPLWEARTGQVSLPLATFFTEITMFHHHFIHRMAERVETAHTYWTDSSFLPHIRSLQQVQHQKAPVLEDTLQEVDKRRQTDWHHVLAALASIENDAQFIALHMTQKDISG